MIFRKGTFEGFFKIIDQNQQSPSFHFVAPRSEIGHLWHEETILDNFIINKK